LTKVVSSPSVCVDIYFWISLLFTAWWFRDFVQWVAAGSDMSFCRLRSKKWNILENYLWLLALAIIRAPRTPRDRMSCGNSGARGAKYLWEIRGWTAALLRSVWRKNDCTSFKSWENFTQASSK
jgi:hypothetical protein